MKTSVLIVDDEPDVRRSLVDIFSDEGYAASGAETGGEAIRLAAAEGFDLVLLDIWLPDTDGLQVLEQLKAARPEMPVIMISGHGTIETAVQSTKLGAFDFIEKPFSLEKLVITAENALTISRLRRENIQLRERFQRESHLIGTSRRIATLREQIGVIGPTNGWVLITGENGTGKELVARAIHRLSPRSGRPFVDVNCAAIPESLIESELLGHEKGAFTGATERKSGKFEQADGGTIFLDEIGDMSLNTQAKILRVLQEQSFTRLGSSRPITIDVRVIAATNKHMETAIEDGTFREDLYYRLNVIPVEVPPLRERPEDIPLLANHFLRRFSGSGNCDGTDKQLDADAMALLQHYAWPGNVRELKNLMERLAIMVPGPRIAAADLPAAMREETDTSAATAAAAGGLDEFMAPSFSEAVDRFESHYLRTKLREFDGNVSRTAAAIGITRRNLHRKIKALEIKAAAEQ
ncbi:MAG: sigma-54-dependent Fis family transcriptional regulator [Deltaproteobacteria bacterium]|nr:sigma-54-dependent Fis family transcriptional regulator [Candidatus Anaeroferrophillacea bacterium]